MRVVLVANTLAGGGIERQAVLMLRELQSRGASCLAVSLGDVVDYVQDGDRHAVVTLGKTRRSDVPRLVYELRRTLKDTDIVIGFNWYPSLLAWMARPRARRILRFGGTLASDGVVGVRLWLTRMAARRSEAIVGCSWGVTREVASAVRSPTATCACIENAVVFMSADADGTDWRPPEGPYLVHVGRLEPVKDQATLLRAFASLVDRIPHALVIAGHGSCLHELRSLAREYGIESRVEFLGAVRNTRPVYTHADAAVFTSLREGFGTVIVEALACGVPVVSTDALPGPREILEGVDERMWRLAPVGDSWSVSHAVLDMIENAPSVEARTDVAHAIERRYSIARTVDSYLRLLHVHDDMCGVVSR